MKTTTEHITTAAAAAAAAEWGGAAAAAEALTAATDAQLAEMHVRVDGLDEPTDLTRRHAGEQADTVAAAAATVQFRRGLAPVSDADLAVHQRMAQDAGDSLAAAVQAEGDRAALPEPGIDTEERQFRAACDRIAAAAIPQHDSVPGSGPAALTRHRYAGGARGVELRRHDPSVIGYPVPVNGGWLVADRIARVRAYGAATFIAIGPVVHHSMACEAFARSAAAQLVARVAAAAAAGAPHEHVMEALAAATAGQLAEMHVLGEPTDLTRRHARAQAWIVARAAAEAADGDGEHS